MIVGIDPGQTGGVAFLSDEGQFLGGIRMPVVQASPKRKVVDLLAIDAALAEYRGVALPGILRAVVIESVHAMPRQGVSSSFSFGLATGAVEAWGVSQPCGVHWVTPQSWKKALNLSSSKQASLDKARLEFGPSQLWDVKANDGVAEAALIGLYWIRNKR